MPVGTPRSLRHAQQRRRCGLPLDPEGLALTKDRDLILTSEGNTNTLLAPFVRRYDLAGDYLSDLPVPGYYLPTADHSSGIRFNLAFESAGVPPNGRFFDLSTNNAANRVVVDRLTAFGRSVGARAACMP